MTSVLGALKNVIEVYNSGPYKYFKLAVPVSFTVADYWFVSADLSHFNVDDEYRYVSVNKDFLRPDLLWSLLPEVPRLIPLVKSGTIGLLMNKLSFAYINGELSPCVCGFLFPEYKDVNRVGKPSVVAVGFNVWDIMTCKCGDKVLEALEGAGALGAASLLRKSFKRYVEVVSRPIPPVRYAVGVNEPTEFHDFDDYFDLVVSMNEGPVGLQVGEWFAVTVPVKGNEAELEALVKVIRGY